MQTKFRKQKERKKRIIGVQKKEKKEKKKKYKEVAFNLHHKYKLNNSSSSITLHASISSSHDPSLINTQIQNH